MSTVHTFKEHVSKQPAPLSAALILAGGAVVAVGLNWLIATTAIAAGASASFKPLALPVFAGLTVIGMLAGWLGWQRISRSAARPARILAIAVPVVTLASFVPDLALMSLRFIPGTTVGAVLALMCMHLVVVAVAVPAYRLAQQRRSAATE